jgi:hypothetical protein
MSSVIFEARAPAFPAVAIYIPTTHTGGYVVRLLPKTLAAKYEKQPKNAWKTPLTIHFEPAWKSN